MSDLYTPEQQFAHMTTKNPLLKELRRVFNLIFE